MKSTGACTQLFRVQYKGCSTEMFIVSSIPCVCVKQAHVDARVRERQHTRQQPWLFVLCSVLLLLSRKLLLLLLLLLLLQLLLCCQPALNCKRNSAKVQTLLLLLQATTTSYYCYSPN
jgi:hypothetical protein